ncbi:MBOAT family protein [Mucilaginibacter limnophilus]|uniref:MBOAT family protein n=1 Tax=Mucilaginibacter limnophilus TaxID=1932778 RepID=A0A3S2UJH2_9SPHI|nr:MBOAT family O-acyltransferase [Mucilaginibacter limnophilus]RVT98358.1 MBOAT family protein [Mucilaginibacter limnophilus]
MLFTDAKFVYFLLVVFALFYIKPLKKYQTQILIAASLLFYYFNSTTFLILLLFSASMNVLFSWLITNSNSFKTRKTFVTIGITLNVLVLVFFKYGLMLVSTFTNETSEVYNFFMIMGLPIGISFYTFEGISLLFDTYKARNSPGYKPVKQNFFTHVKNVFLFISFFPHLIAGPILRANHFFPQIETKHIKNINWQYCFRKLVLGFFLKLVVANNLQYFTAWLQSPAMDNLSSLTLFVLILGFTFQLFADFAGYSYIALGLAGLFGYQLEENFDYPFVSSSLSELWRRWHITLSSFLRYYVYTNLLGGGRRGKVVSLINIFLTMVLAGLWHGSKWSFAIWGSIHGSALVIEHLIKKGTKSWGFTKVRNVLGWVISYFFVIVPCMALFRFPTLQGAIDYAILFLNNTDYKDDYRLITYLCLYSSPIVLMHLLYKYKNTRPVHYVFNKADYLVYGPMLFFIVVNGAQSSPFIYFNF